MMAVVTSASLEEFCFIGCHNHLNCLFAVGNGQECRYATKSNGISDFQQRIAAVIRIVE
jgi:hypothetical protein